MARPARRGAACATRCCLRASALGVAAFGGSPTASVTSCVWPFALCLFVSTTSPPTATAAGTKSNLSRLVLPRNIPEHAEEPDEREPRGYLQSVSSQFPLPWLQPLQRICKA